MRVSLLFLLIAVIIGLGLVFVVSLCKAAAAADRILRRERNQ